MKNIFYLKHINKIGGIETFFYQLAKKYKDWDITIVFKSGDPIQIARLENYVRLVRFEPGMKFECEKAFFNFNADIIDNIDAKEYAFIIHGDYKTLLNSFGMRPPQHEKITRHYGVSETACKTFEEITGIKAYKTYNPFSIEEPKRLLRLISATRLSREKGKERMIKLANALDSAGIPFTWDVYTNDVGGIDNPSINYRVPKLNLTNEIAAADYLVQLSSSEAYCYSTAEANALGTAVIVTDLECFKELKNVGYILPLDMEDIPVDEIYNKIPKVKWTAPEDRWDKILVKGKSTYAKERSKMPKVKALNTYKIKNIKDAELKKIPEEGEEFTVSKARLSTLLGDNPYEIAFVEEIKQTKGKGKQKAEEQEQKPEAKAEQE